jgi:periplasmic copper chaperone A
MAGAATVVVAIGVAGLVRAAMPQSIARGPDESVRAATASVVASPSGSASPAPAPSITITGAYVRQPASPAGPAAAYLTIINTSAIADTLISVESADAAKAQLRAGASRTQLLSGVKIPAHTTVRLSASKTHIVVEHPDSPLRPGATQNLELWFDRAGPIVVPAPVLSATAPIPTLTVTK